MANLSDYIVRWALKRGVHDLPFPPSGPTTVDLGTHTIDSASGSTDIVDLGEGGHILSPVVCIYTAIDFDVEVPDGNTYLTTDPVESIDIDVWPALGGDYLNLEGPNAENINTGSLGALPLAVVPGEVPLTLYAGPVMVGRFIRVQYVWGTNVGPDASATFSVTAVVT